MTFKYHTHRPPIIISENVKIIISTKKGFVKGCSLMAPRTPTNKSEPTMCCST
uniref:Bm697 n=1 Tax=Brugia malayi TaxID=6279 RepID=A0A1I9GDF2_BRUMA|nr:Bm697 [Brugia malayi]